MPVYEFKCRNDDCENEEIYERFDTNRQKLLYTWCPSCKKEMTKIVSQSDFFLKGSNWSKDNYGLKT